MSRAAFSKAIATHKTLALDSMIFSYYFFNAPPYATLCETLFDAVEEKTITITTSVISYLEALSAQPITDAPKTLIAVKSFFLSHPSLQLIPVTPAITETAASLRREHGLSTPDAIHIATAQESDSAAFVTNDKHFRRIKPSTGLRVYFLDDFLS